MPLADYQDDDDYVPQGQIAAETSSDDDDDDKPGQYKHDGVNNCYSLRPSQAVDSLPQSTRYIVPLRVLEGAYRRPCSLETGVLYPECPIKMNHRVQKQYFRMKIWKMTSNQLRPPRLTSLVLS